MGLLDTVRAFLAPRPPALAQVQAQPSATPPVSPVAGDSNPVFTAQLDNELRSTGADPRRKNYWGARRSYSDDECERLSRNGLAHRCVSIRAFDATREGFTVRFTDLEPDEAQAANAHLRGQWKRLSATPKIRRALTKGGVYGHSIVVVGVDDGAASLAEPLNQEAVKRVLWLRVYSRPEYTLGPLSPPTSPNFNYPEWYDIHDFHRPEVEAFEAAPRGTFSGTKRVHHSRILGPFHTEDGNSELDAIGTALEDYFATQTAASQTVDTMSIGVFKIKGWLGRLAQNATAALGRIQVAERGLSLINSMVIGDDEEFNYASRPISGLGDMVEAKGVALCAHNGIPPMILLGADPKGWSTGEEIVKRYDTTVRAVQTDELEAPIAKLVDLLLRSEDGPPLKVSREAWGIIFNPLRTPSLEELTAARTSTWTAASQLVEKDLITRDEFRNSLFGDPNELTPTLQLSDEGSAQEVKTLPVGVIQALTQILAAAYPNGAPPEVYRAVIEGALPTLTEIAPRIFPDAPPPEPGSEAAPLEPGVEALDESELQAERWITPEEIAGLFGSITKGQLKSKRTALPRTREEGRLSWTKPGRTPLYRLSEVAALFDLAGPDLEPGTEDDPPEGEEPPPAAE